MDLLGFSIEFGLFAFLLIAFIFLFLIFFLEVAKINTNLKKIRRLLEQNQNDTGK